MKKFKQHNGSLIVQKSRSYRSDFSESWRIFILNLSPLMKSLLVPFGAIGLILAVLFALWRLSSPVAVLIEGIAALLFILYAVSVAVCITRYLLHDNIDFATRHIRPIPMFHGASRFLVEALNPFYLLVLESSVFAFIVWGGMKLFYIKESLALLAVVAAFIVSVPFTVSFSGMAFSEEHSFKRCLEGARLGFSGFWGTMMLVFLSFLILGTVTLVLFLPIFVINLAISASNTAVSYGDPTDLPNYVYVLHFFLTIILMTTATFSSLIGFISQYLRYYSLLTKKNERDIHREMAEE